MKELSKKFLTLLRKSLLQRARAANLDRPLHKLTPAKHGGEIVADTLKFHDIKQIFTLSGGHISPILTGCDAAGVRVIDTRSEASAAFAADAASRLSSVPGVVVVTAGPGVTNTVTAVKNAQMAESAMVVICGAAPTLLAGRGALQDVDQLSIFQSLCKETVRVTRVRDLQHAVSEALSAAQDGVPGPVLLEIPIDVLYPYQTVREMAGLKDGARNWAMRWAALSVDAVFAGVKDEPAQVITRSERWGNAMGRFKAYRGLLNWSQRPVLILGSQAMLPGGKLAAEKLRLAVQQMGIPVYLGGMTRGLMGPSDPCLFRLSRKAALKEADLVILAGAVTDFRLDYGRSINKNAKVMCINRSLDQANLNEGVFWKATFQVKSDIVQFFGIAGQSRKNIPEWIEKLRDLEDESEAKIREEGAVSLEGGVNPVLLFQVLDTLLGDNSVLIGDGGDFVGTAARVLRPTGPLGWFDPGPYGTLGVGGGFALGVKSVRKTSEVWVLWGDGSSTYSLAEVEPSVRQNLPFIGIIGNDSSWGQIARDQVKMLGSDTACSLTPNVPYHRVAEGLGAVGLEIGAGAGEAEIRETLEHAQRECAEGRTVVVNVILGKSKFREGSVSV